MKYSIIFKEIKMNCIVLKGSYHKNGYISSLVKNFINGLKENNKGLKAEIIDLMDKNINFCRGCLKCNSDNGESLGKCNQNDDMQNILKKMVEADILVYASPIYQFTITALFKKFNERTMPVLFRSKKSPFPQPRNKIKKGKKGVVLLSTGAPFPFNVLFGMTKYAKKIFFLFCRAFGCEKNFILQAGGVGNEKMKNQYLNKAFNLGLKVGVI